jgi:pimeloyl-ACP methyl ester carboxylesterase
MAGASRPSRLYRITTMTSPDQGSPSRAPMPESVDEGFFAEIDGMAQWIAIRGRDRRNPALFFLHGTGVGYSAFAPVFAAWEEDFTLVFWDQPGAGATHARNGAGAGALSFDRLTRDAVAAIDIVRARLGVGKVIALGMSGGTILGLKLARMRPDLLSACVGNGQVVHWARQETLAYRLLLDRARTEGNTEAVSDLERLGPPPWPDVASVAVKAKYANAPTPKEQAALAALGAQFAAAMNPPADAAYVPHGLPAFDPMAQATAAFAALKPEFEAFDARALGLAFEVPMIFLQGAEDVHTVSSEVEAYAAEIAAPHKAYVAIPGAGHVSSFLIAEMLALLKAHVRPLAVGPATGILPS